MTAVLLLNADFLPLRLISWERAVSMLLDGRARMVEQAGEKFIHSVSQVLPWPAVVALTEYVAHRGKLKFSYANIKARDAYTCQYCGAQPKTPTGRPDGSALTIDHVVPTSRAFLKKGRKADVSVVRHYLTGADIPSTSWENCTTACIPCNGRKADKTPSEAKMTLRREPTRPSSVVALKIWLIKAQIPPEGEAYLKFE